ncbi:Conserved oligomeric Golgi complex subunit 4 [Dichanthelium oligosanthes]|uniref:Conserved oligomeric Golgi complex subunit 4 n=1 Tax=Dichanthelium oligosanthes TaxID=888268 RepID=A0A1E5VLC9_9POAL|nr:Conserved oligomeric Golgi complex subunit 4 [Dichanthelium oligosanthes]
MAVASASSTPRSPRRPEAIMAPDSSSADAQPSLDFGDPASLAALRALTDAGAAARLLHKCVAYQRALDARLDSLLARRADIDRAAASLLRSAPPLLSLAASDATALKESSSTAALADALSSRFSHLDTAHSRADAALARAETALDRSRALEEARGEDGVAYAIIELQEECDSRGTQILRRYADYRKLAPLSSDINSYTKNLLSVVGSMASAAGGNEGSDPREIELYLEEILALTQLGEDYTEFMVNKIRGLRDVKPELGPQAMKAFRNGSFNKWSRI